MPAGSRLAYVCVREMAAFIDEEARGDGEPMFLFIAYAAVSVADGPAPPCNCSTILDMILPASGESAYGDGLPMD